MQAQERIDIIRDGLRRELTEHLLPFWRDRTLDEVDGGFVGKITQDGEIVPDAPKGSVLNARILWTFSAAAHALDEEGYLKLADRARSYLCDHFCDHEYGGVYWTVDAKGRPLDTTKKTYALAFAIYGLSEHFKASGDPTALDEAITLFRVIERHAFDPHHSGYFEAFSRSWGPLDDVRLGEGDDNAPKSMNTQLHVLEAYTNLHECWQADLLRMRLKSLTELLVEKIFHPDAGQMSLFFEADWSPRSNTYSYGHDIEANWLLLRAVDKLGDPELRRRVRGIALDLADSTYAKGQDEDGGIFWIGDASGPVDTDKHWWPQAEAIVGFLNAYRESHDDRYLEAAERAWSFVREKVIDEAGGEWFGRLNRAGERYDDEDKVGLWKCPYHNTRACLEVLEETAIGGS